MSNTMWSVEQLKVLKLAEQRVAEERLKAQYAQMKQQVGIKSEVPGRKLFDMYERTQLALTQLQILHSVGELQKPELLNAMKMAISLDRENLVIVEEIIKLKLG
jgi:hypothetical protein